MTRGTAEPRVVLHDPERERGAAWTPVLLPLECCGCGDTLDALLVPPVSAEMHCPGWPLELLFTDSFVLCKLEVAAEEQHRKSCKYIF